MLFFRLCSPLSGAQESISRRHKLIRSWLRGRMNSGVIVLNGEDGERERERRATRFSGWKGKTRDKNIKRKNGEKTRFRFKSINRRDGPHLSITASFSASPHSRRVCVHKFDNRDVAGASVDAFGLFFHRFQPTVRPHLLEAHFYGSRSVSGNL